MIILKFIKHKKMIGPVLAAVFVVIAFAMLSNKKKG
jgi:hypothetical protein